MVKSLKIGKSAAKVLNKEQGSTTIQKSDVKPSIGVGLAIINKWVRIP